MVHQEQRWMLVSEMAEHLRTSRRTVLNAAARGRLESVRLGPQTIRVRLPVDRRERRQQGRNGTP
jgi:excisionase family DNA binding protein